jgi:spore maturation protein CgeB
MKILFVGTVQQGQTSRMRMQVLRDIGHDVQTLDSLTRWSTVSRPSRVAQQWSCRGPVVEGLNRDFIAAVDRWRPDLVWAEKQQYLRPQSLERASALGAKLVHYTPDPYFTLAWKRTSLADAAMPLYDALITSKRYELEQYRAVGKQVVYMPLGFSDQDHRPLVPASRSDVTRFSSDVSFLGGWEPRREEMLSALASSVVCELKLWGYGWDHVSDGKVTPRRWATMRRNAGGAPYSIRRNEALAHSLQGGEVYAAEYAYALSGARISIGFLRRICPDEHTTRTFEIPACGSMLLADRSDEHLDMFREGVEAEFFDSSAELADKVRFYLAHEDIRAKVALGGFRRCHDSGYSYNTRMRLAIGEIGFARTRPTFTAPRRFGAQDFSMTTDKHR